MQSSRDFTNSLPLRSVVKRDPILTDLGWVSGPGRGRFEFGQPLRPSGYSNETLECGHVLSQQTGEAKRRRCGECVDGRQR